VAGAAESFPLITWLCVKVVVLSALARDVVTVRADDFAALALTELAHVDPNLLVVALAKVAIVHISLIVTDRVRYLRCLCLSAYC